MPCSGLQLADQGFGEYGGGGDVSILVGKYSGPAISSREGVIEALREAEYVLSVSMLMVEGRAFSRMRV